MRPWRMSSLRVHISLTGRPSAFDTCAASMAGLEEQAVAERPAAPDDVERHLTAPAGRSRVGDLLAGDDRALRRAPDLGPVGADVGDAVSTSSGACGANAKSKVRSIVRRAERRHGERAASPPQLGADLRVGERGVGARVPGDPQRVAGRAGPGRRSAAVTATPVGMRVTRDARRASRGRRRRRPRRRSRRSSAGGRRRSAWRRARRGRGLYSARPVTMSRASMRVVRLADQGELRRVLRASGRPRARSPRRGRREGPERRRCARRARRPSCCG